jgi:Zn-dependent peptidase ImmA (M78 family)
MYFYTETAGACIALNKSHPYERRLMSLAHDYSHFLASRHHPVILIEDRYQRLPESERFAGAFGPAFLMPADRLTRRFNEIRKAQGTVTVADLLRLAHYYGVSFEAFTNRLEDLRLLPIGTGKKLKDGGLRIRQAQEQLGLAPIPVQDEMLPLRYRYLAFVAFESGLISEGRFARFLRVERLEARDIAEKLQAPELSEDTDLNLTEAVR